MSLVSEFRTFVQRGNVVDLAVAVVIGAAFGKVVTSFTDNVLMPPLGLLLGRTDFSNLFVALNGGSYPSVAVARAAGAPVLAYGMFINAIIEFLLIALGVFLVVKAVNRFYASTAKEACPRCDTLISTKATRCPACTSDLRPGLATTWLPETPETVQIERRKLPTTGDGEPRP